MNFFGWLNSRGFSQGAFWSVLTCFVSVSNDVIVKLVGTRLDGLEISFFRFLFSMLTVLPFMIAKGKVSFKTTNPSMHWWRAIVGVAAIALFTYGLIFVPLAEVTVFSFTQPLFFMPLAIIFLREKVSFGRWIAVILGFVGILVMIDPASPHFSFYVFFPMTAAFLFATLDLMAKKMVSNESTLTLLFYFALGTTIAGFIPALMVWKTPDLRELFWLFALGAGANLIQVCLFKAFSATEASSLAPFRYVELIFSAFFGFFLFSESIKMKTLLGAAIIITSTLYMSYFEVRRKRKQKNT
jgi:S-adenosylmethionine uptake transporter